MRRESGEMDAIDINGNVSEFKTFLLGGFPDIFFVVNVVHGEGAQVPRRGWKEDNARTDFPRTSETEYLSGRKSTELSSAIDSMAGSSNLISFSILDSRDLLTQDDDPQNISVSQVDTIRGQNFHPHPFANGRGLAGRFWPSFFFFCSRVGAGGHKSRLECPPPQSGAGIPPSSSRRHSPVPHRERDRCLFGPLSSSGQASPVLVVRGPCSSSIRLSVRGAGSSQLEAPQPYHLFPGRQVIGPGHFHCLNELAMPLHNFDRGPLFFCICSELLIMSIAVPHKIEPHQTGHVDLPRCGL